MRLHANTRVLSGQARLAFRAARAAACLPLVRPLIREMEGSRPPSQQLILTANQGRIVGKWSRNTSVDVVNAKSRIGR